ncbi:MAG: VCBS repeat-containing protein [Nevskia sp.]|nr:VCBS repeat-containing protein [Nevskia sp.]
MNRKKLMALWSGAACLLLGSGMACASTPITFAPQVDYSTFVNFTSGIGPGPAPESMVTADVNNDGHPDIIAVNWIGLGLTLSLGRGDGTFASPQLINFPQFLQSVDAADVNGDGKVDLIVTNAFQVFVLLGDGKGNFTQSWSAPLLTGAQNVAFAADLNGDGKKDIVALTLGNLGGIQSFIGQGNGQFTTGPFTSLPGALSAASLANFNNDGIPDLAVVNASTIGFPLSRVYALLGDGKGGFNTVYSSALAGIIAEDVATADLDGDGVDDIVTADSFSFTVSVILSNGKGGFGQASYYPGSIGPVSIALADLNGDHNLDIIEAVVGTATVQVFPGLGGGRFGSPLQLPVVPFPQTPVIADFNGDGKPDIAVSGPFEMGVLMNTSAYTP